MKRTERDARNLKMVHSVWTGGSYKDVSNKFGVSARTVREAVRVYGKTPNPTTATDTQVGGSHYKDMKIQPTEFIMANGIGFVEGNVIKYVCRWKRKGGVEDLKKARHYLDLLIQANDHGDDTGS